MSPSPERESGYPTSAFEYSLPSELIARHPTARRDESRLLVVERATGSITDHAFRELPDFVAAGDAVVLNETRVIPARLLGRRAGGGAAEVLLLRPVAPAAGAAPAPDARFWDALVRPGARLRPGRRVEVAPELAVEIVALNPDGTRVVRLESPLPTELALERYGRVPLPPYLGREAEPDDIERYQTVYARERGSVAAPTAGLHFTPAVLHALESGGVELVRLVLHVGAGTFRPVEEEDPARHRMHSEWYRLPAEAAASLNALRARGGRCWAVGTTVARTLESVADPDGRLAPSAGWTDIFIRPPHRFRAVDRLLTNFHLPRSTLLMLVAAFAGRELVLEAYRQAVERRYRFYSYGDAMLVV